MIFLPGSDLWLLSWVLKSIAFYSQQISTKIWPSLLFHCCRVFTLKFLWYISPLTHYSSLWVCLNCLFCSHCDSNHAYHRGQNHPYSIYIILKALSTYITWQPLKTACLHIQHFPCGGNKQSLTGLQPFLPGQKNWLNSVLDFEQKKSIVSSPLPLGYS